MAADHSLPTDPADLELSLTPLGERYALTLRLHLPSDASELRRGPFSVGIAPATLLSNL